MRQEKERLSLEILRLTRKNIQLRFRNDTKNDIEVLIAGPAESPFKDGKFLVNILVPDDYPFKSPSIGFVTKVFHPNIDENSGSVCLDVLNQVWSPLYDLGNIIETFIPQLLSYPNALDPLNTEAANLFINDRKRYDQVVEEYVRRYGVKDDIVCEGSSKESNSDGFDSEDLGI